MRGIAQILRKEYGLNAGSLEQEEDDDEEDGDDEEEEEEEEEEQELDAPRASHGSWGQMLANSEAEAASVRQAPHLANHTSRLFLIGDRRLPRLVNILCRVILKLGQPASDVVAVLIVLFGEGDGGVASEVLVEEARAREPHPVPIVDRPISV